MSRALKTLEAAKRNPKGVSFSELQGLAEAAGFALKRTKGSHHVYSKPGVVEIIDLQAAGKDAKTYQVRQVLDLIEKYGIEIK